MKEVLFFIAILVCNIIAYGAGYTAGIKRTIKDIEKIVDDAFKELEYDNERAKKENSVL